jgi:cysteine desulfurase
LWVAKKPGLKLQALLHGGGHEAGLRSGTLNVPGIVGMGKAAALAQQNLATYRTKLTALQSALELGLREALPEIYIMGSTVGRLPNTTNVCLTGCTAASIIKTLRHLGMATGSACSSAAASPSHVLTAMGLLPEQAASCLRISLGWPTTEAEVKSTIQDLAEAVQKARAESPAWLYREKSNPF